jgi:hypothetical protein
VNRSRYPSWPAPLALLRANPHDAFAPLAILHECEPEDLAQWNESAYCWVRAVIGYDEDEQPRTVLAPAIFDRLPFRPGDDPESILRRYSSENAGYRALWEACSDYASSARPKAKT